MELLRRSMNIADIRALNLSKADVILTTEPVLAEYLATTPMPWLKKKLPILCVPTLDAVRGLDEAKMNELGWFRKPEGV